MPVVNDYTALLSDYSWAGNGSTNTPAIVTYSFETRAQSYLSSSGFNQSFVNSFQQFSALDKVYAREAVNQWAQASGIVLIEVPAGQGDLKFAKYDFDYDSGLSSAAGFAYFPSRDINDSYVYDQAIGGDVFINTDVSNSVFLMLHEIGHALGLEHSFDGENVLASHLDNHSNTVMSYTGGGSSRLGYLDVQAATHMYGGWSADGDHVSSWSWDAQTVELTQIGFNIGDDIYGTGVSDIIDGRGGNDRLAGFVGDDRLSGGSGSDRIFGGSGDDILSGGAGNDYIYGGDYQGDGSAGSDTASFADDTGGVDADISGSRWSGSRWYDAFGSVSGYDNLYDIDHLIGGSGNDRLVGNSGANRLEGGTGNDEINGGLGDDWLVGGNGDDELIGGGGADTLLGEAGNDRIIGGSGFDQIWGGDGWDEIFGDDGNDMIYGGGKGDSISGGVGNDTLNGGDGWDVIWGGAGWDIIAGDAGDDTLHGGGQGDQIGGGGGNDKIYGGDGWDIIWGGTGWDTLSGDAGNDTIRGGAKGDLIGGGAGADTIYGDAGWDVIWGGIGNDTFVFEANWGRDTIKDFNTNGEILDISALGITFDDLDILQVGNDAVVSINGDLSNDITLSNVAATTISQSDFLIA